MPRSQTRSISSGTPSIRYSFGIPIRLPRTSLSSAASQFGHRQIERGRILRIEAGHRFEQDRAVADVAGHRPGLVEAGGEGDDAPARAAAVGRLDPGDPDEGGGLADRAAGVGAGDSGREPGRDRRRRAARASARGERRIAAVAPPPGREDRAPGAGLVGRAHRELVHVQLAEHSGAGGEQIGADRQFVARLEAFEDPAAGGGGDALGGEQVLDPERHARERLQIARGAGGVGGVGGGEGVVRGLDGEGVEPPALLDGGAERPGDLARGKGAVAHPVADRGDSEVGEVGHGVTPAKAGASRETHRDFPA